jgi:glycosyltransferase involved in cell wall biosynthesis/GT2 family glycosyltransferase
VARSSPLVSVLVSAHDAARYLRLALASVLRQTLSDLELIVVDDGSADGTGEILDAIDDPRLVVLRNDERIGLAASLNRALDAASGRYVARHDADDVALPHRLERQVAHLRANPRFAIVGSAVLELDASGTPVDLHLMPSGPLEVRWASLFSSPFFHPSVLVDRELLAREGLRYEPGFLESEDYELWTRVLRFGEGDNIQQPLVLYRVHATQASQARRDLQLEFQRRVALGEIARAAPDLGPESVELAWRVGAGEEVGDRLEDALAGFTALAETFAGGAARTAAARSLASFARSAPTAGKPEVVRAALRLDPTLAVRGLVRKARRATSSLPARRAARRWLADLEVDIGARLLRVAAVFPEPTPYRAPLLDRIADSPDLDLTVIYAAETVAGRTWHVEPRHRAVFLRGMSIPGAEKVLRHGYPVTPGVAHVLSAARPDVLVVSGWSTFAAQAALAWSRLHGVQYVLVVESHDEDARPAWRRAVKGAFVPAVVKGASGVLVTGTLARRSMLARGADPDHVHVFANTVDVEAFGARVDELAPRRPELRSDLGAGVGDVIVLSVGRLAPEKGMDDLVRAVAAAGEPRLLLLIAGDGPERARLEELAAELGVRLSLVGDRAWDGLAELYLAADVFALLSRSEPWGVVVNEAAASGLPIVASAAVGAAHDLVHEGESGFVVPTGDVDAAATALARLAAEPELMVSFGGRSREIARDWGYGPSVEAFLAAVRTAATRPQD